MSENETPTPIENEAPVETPTLFTQADLDRARTQASKTARENAKKDLLNDEETRAYFRELLEKEAAMSAEQKYQVELEKVEKTRRELSLKENRLFAKQTLLDSGIAQTEIDTILDFVTTEDSKQTEDKVKNFLNVFSTTVDTVVKEKTKQFMQNSDTPRGGENLSETAAYKANIDALRKMGTTEANAMIIQLEMDAHSKGIVL